VTLAGIIFDFNGVLFWDEDLQRQAWTEYARRLRPAPLAESELKRYCLGVPNKDSLEYILGQALTLEEADRLTQEKEAIYRQLCLDNPEQFCLSPGAIPLLEALKRRQIPRTIATSSEKQNVDFFVIHLELGRWFEVGDIQYDDGSYPGKPDPQIYLRAAAKISLPPAQCVIVEDSLAGLEAARRAGSGCVIALGAPEKQDALAVLPGVQRVISQLGELLESDLFAV
jgi:beta-phosphoglucomutase